MSVFEVRITERAKPYVNLQILTVIDCTDQDDCESRIAAEYPDWEIKSIRDISQ